MSTTTIDPRTDAWRDYVAVVNGGVRPTDRAKQRGITGATVSANVKRIRDAIAAGAALPDGDVAYDDNGTTSIVPTFNAWVTDQHGDDVAMAVSMIDTTLASVHRDRDRANDAVTAATERLTTCDQREAAVTAMFERIAPDGVPTLDALHTAYDEHAATLTTPDAATS